MRQADAGIVSASPPVLFCVFLGLSSNSVALFCSLSYHELLLFRQTRTSIMWGLDCIIDWNVRLYIPAYDKVCWTSHVP